MDSFSSKESGPSLFVEPYHSICHDILEQSDAIKLHNMTTTPITIDFDGFIISDYWSPVKPLYEWAMRQLVMEVNV